MTAGYTGRGIEVRLGDRPVLNVDALALNAGTFTAVAGPNGAGKSTLLLVLAGLLRPGRGECSLGGRSLDLWPTAAWARKVSYLPQRVEIPFAFTAWQVVMMGRAAHAEKMFDSPEDEAVAAQALSQVGAADLANRDFRTLSGGERQRVLVAAALAQSAEVLLLDEPAAALDLKHQVALYGLLRQQAERGSLVVAATHNLAMAARFAHRVLLLDQGRVAAEGPPAEALTPATVERVFEVDFATAGLGAQ